MSKVDQSLKAIEKRIRFDSLHDRVVGIGLYDLQLFGSVEAGSAGNIAHKYKKQFCTKRVADGLLVIRIKNENTEPVRLPATPSVLD